MEVVSYNSPFATFGSDVLRGLGPGQKKPFVAQKALQIMNCKRGAHPTPPYVSAQPSALRLDRTGGGASGSERSSESRIVSLLHYNPRRVTILQNNCESYNSGGSLLFQGANQLLEIGKSGDFAGG